jgi:hypothetical protein
MAGGRITPLFELAGARDLPRLEVGRELNDQNRLSSEKERRDTPTATPRIWTNPGLRHNANHSPERIRLLLQAAWDTHSRERLWPRIRVSRLGTHRFDGQSEIQAPQVRGGFRTMGCAQSPPLAHATIGAVEEMPSTDPGEDR